MMRKIAITWTPAPTLDALLTLISTRPRARGGSAVVHDELRRELRRALAALEPSLARVASCIAWLERRGHASMGRAAHAVEGVSCAALRGGALRVDLAALDAAAHEETRGLDGKAHATLYALRATLRALQRAELFTVTSTRAGARRVALDDVLREVERAAKRHGFRDDATIPARFAPPVEPAPPPAAPPPATKPRASAPKRAKPTRATPGFGGLPDDAVSDAPPPPPPAPDPRAPSPDAQFFLRAAEIDAWPCPRATLDRARRAVITRLHPDRAGDEASRDFHRAIKGHAELVALLALLDPREVPEVPPAAQPAQPAQPAAPEKRARRPRERRPTPPPAPAAAYQEWPPPPPPPPPRVVRAIPLDDDAHFFLRESSVSWPCAPDALRVAWSALSTRLRRMTPASSAAASFARASRGFSTLLQAAGAAA